jgi:hypothetical protein
MVLVAKARHLEIEALSHVKSLTEKVTNLAEGLEERPQASEPLLSWFDENAALVFRNLERALRILLVNDESNMPLFRRKTWTNISSLAALFYVALFRVLRNTLTPFTTSNPTWIKTPKANSDKLHTTRDEVTCAFLREIKVMTSVLEASYARFEGKNPRAKIELGTSTSLPLGSDSVGAVISSPPYCTRIDYAVATLPELYLLGCDGEVLRSLRDQMIGTPTMSKNVDPEMAMERSRSWGNTAADFLRRVHSHESKASSTYYLRYFMQYFDGIERSLREISRVLKPHSPCVLVVQDSHYKEVRLDLANVYQEMAETFHLKSQGRINYPNGSSLARINRGTRRYRERVNAVESVLMLYRSSDPT